MSNSSTAQPFVARLESGQRRVDLVEFLDLADVLGFDPGQPTKRLGAVRAGRRPRWRQGMGRWEHHPRNPPTLLHKFTLGIRPPPPD